jgi:PAS domain S-box-containing protein
MARDSDLPGDRLSSRARPPEPREADSHLTRTLQELQRQRRRLEDFARATSDWFWETDTHGHLIHLSDRMTAIAGVPAATFIGQRLDQFGQFVPGELGSVVEAMRQRRPFRDRLFQFPHASGRMLVFNLAGVPVFDPLTGTFLGYRGSGFDMTPRYRAEEAAKEARRELEKALEDLTNKNIEADLATAQAAAALHEKSDFIASFSHELRTPLNAVIGFAEAMTIEVFGPLDDRYRQYSEDILGAARHLLELINDILDQATVESGKLRIEKSAMPLDALIEESVALVRLRALTKSIDLVLPGKGTDIAVEVDPRRARQILVNLLGNAVKFTPEGGRMGVEVAPPDRAGLVAVTIWDSGIGIPAREHEKVFERFEQATGDDYVRRQEGTGLGLAISRDLARMMGGDITLESEFGAGSRFTVTFSVAS